MTDDMESSARRRDPMVTHRIMRAVRAKDTKPEMVLRRAVHARGGRFRLHPRDVPGCPDLVVRSRKVAVFVDGDLWHGNPAEWKRRGRASLAEMFPTRTEWWVEKIERNIARDRSVDDILHEAGWKVVRLWASDVLAEPDQSADIVMEVLRPTV
jgi:DNA mismatch endonuclease (patch repair protein)